ncbi:MAG TPA: dienelactone hydrolase family protein [Pedobacter sp.]|nr:dienelactone hydrolase family protein [Pedobacter sp.]
MNRTFFFFAVLISCLLNVFNVSAQKLNKQSAAQLVMSAYAHEASLQKQYAEEIWTNKQVKYGDYLMKFEYRKLGDKPAGGRSLYISMHGGGNTSPKANDQQWKNQISLYTPAEGIYLAPRAPTDTWNLWHEDHIDTMFLQIIKAAVLMEEVNPNRVYVMGYSAGGDGTFQIASRMADHWAAAAMMAGHPGDAAALNLRNLPFAIYMGGADGAYKRNELAAVWGEKLDSLESTEPGSFKHDVHIYEGMPHWMSRKDTVAVPWMASFTRNPLPKKVAWKQDDRHHDTFYWLGVPISEAKTGAESIVSISGNVISVEKNEHTELHIYLNDILLDLDKKVKVLHNGEVVFNGKVPRSAGLITQTAKRLDPDFIFTAMLTLKAGKVFYYK